MSLSESIVEDADLIMPAATLARPLPAAISPALRFPAGEVKREGIRQLNPAIPNEARATIRQFRRVRNSTGRESNP